MMKSLFFPVVVFSLAITSCHKPQPAKPITEPPGICMLPYPVDTLEIYRSGSWAPPVHCMIVEGSVYRDSLFDKNIWIKLPDNTYQKVQSLPHFIPTELYDTDNAKYGDNTGTADFPTTVVICKRYGKTHNWTFEYNPPQQLASFVEKIHTTLQHIENK